MIVLVSFNKCKYVGCRRHYFCLECKEAFSKYHFSRSFMCALCEYTTSCGAAFFKHVVVHHSSKSTVYARRSQFKEIKLLCKQSCICGFCSRSGMKLADHLAKCETAQGIIIVKLPKKYKKRRPRCSPTFPHLSEMPQQGKHSGKGRSQKRGIKERALKHHANKCTVKLVNGIPVVLKSKLGKKSSARIPISSNKSTSRRPHGKLKIKKKSKLCRENEVVNSVSPLVNTLTEDDGAKSIVYQSSSHVERTCDKEDGIQKKHLNGQMLPVLCIPRIDRLLMSKESPYLSTEEHPKYILDENCSESTGELNSTCNEESVTEQKDGIERNFSPVLCVPKIDRMLGPKFLSYINNNVLPCIS